MQLASQEGTTNLYIRRKHNSTWTSWEKIYPANTLSPISSVNLNDIKTPGIYYTANTNITNTPPHASYNQCILIVRKNGYNSNYINQLAFYDYRGPEMASRTYTGSVWGEWIAG